MDLTVVLADLHPEAATLAASTEHLPELPAFSTLLRFGTRARVSEDWRTWFARLLGRADLSARPIAQIAAAALPGPATAVCLATPVHLLAGIDHVRLHPAGLLRLDAAQAAQLATSFAAVFGDSGWQLRPLAGDLLLQGLELPRSDGLSRAARDPGRWLGANIAPAVSQEGLSPLLRRATAEIEMWLHEHPVNRVRASRGELVVNSLWLWGEAGTPGPIAGAAAEAPDIFAQDAFVSGLCAASGLALPAPPRRYADLNTSAWVVLSAAARDARDAPLLRIEAEWLLPALAAMRAGRLARLRLHAGSQQVTLQASNLRRFWRRARPWWQRLSAV